MILRESRTGAIALVMAAVLELTTLTERVARADASGNANASKDEARDRFDRGLKLFNEGDNAGALAEFKRAYELIPNALVLYNIGLVYAAMARPVDAADALAKVLAAPVGVSPERLTRAKQTYAEQSARVAEVLVVTNVPATVEIDNVEAGKTPLSAPLRVASGARVVGAYATGYAPLRREITIAGGAKAEVKLDLVAMQGRAAHVTVRTHLPDADVYIDGQPVGRTPLPGSLTVEPGHHRVELRRAGYVAAAQDLTLGDGASGELAFELSEDKPALARDGGTLALALSEPQAVVTVDGQARGTYQGPLELAPGAHDLLVERGGFLPSSRRVHVETARTSTASIELVPTPETRADYVAHATAQRTWGTIATVGGVVLLGGGVTMLLLDASTRRTQQPIVDDIAKESVRGNMGRCDPASGREDNPGCDPRDAQQKIADSRTRDGIAYVAGGVGLGAAALGVYLLLSGDSPHRYDAKPSARVQLTPAFGAFSGWVLSGTY